MLEMAETLEWAQVRPREQENERPFVFTLELIWQVAIRVCLGLQGFPGTRNFQFTGTCLTWR
jgi:hypothetical protein